MRNKVKKQTLEKNTPFAEEEGLENLIKEMMTDKEVEDLLKEGSIREQAACVANERKKCNEQGGLIGRIIDIPTWMFPGSK